jgi:hypothetical protein
MMKRHPVSQIVIVLCLLGLSGGAWAESHKGDKDDEHGKHEEKVAKASPAMVYVPPKRDAPRTRVGGATRSAGSQTASIEVIAPQSVGLTLGADPVLYWYLPELTKNEVGLRVLSSHSDEPILKAKLPTPKQAGLQRVRLADHGLALERDIDYQWFIAIPGNVAAQERDQFAGGGIARIDAPADLAEKLGGAGTERASVLVNAGIWYDAVDALSRAIEAAPKDAALVRTRADLLSQVGLVEAAKFERARADRL